MKQKKLPKSSPCPVCGRFDNRGLTVDVVIKKANRLVLIKRGVEPAKGWWALPGGHVEWDETAEDAVTHEVKEETGLEVTSYRLVGVYSQPGREPHQKITLAYLAEAEGELKAGDDALSVKWFDLDKLPDKIAFDHGEIIEACLKA